MSTTTAKPITVWIDANANDPLELDASISEDHKSEVEVTDHPVETGINVSDYARPKPDEVTIEGLVSNSPITAGTTPNNGQADTAYLKLLGLKDHPKLVAIITELRTYYDMVMTGLTVPRNAQTGDVLRFQATFKQVRTVTSATAVVATKQVKTKPKVQLGTKPTATNTKTPTGEFGRFWNQISTAGQTSGGA